MFCEITPLEMTQRPYFDKLLTMVLGLFVKNFNAFWYIIPI